MPERLKISRAASSGSNSTAADRSALSYDSYEPALRLPTENF
jgi:hypothetical protein